MEMKWNRIICFLFIFLMLSTQTVSGDDWYDEYGNYYKVYNIENNELIFEAARKIEKGDQYLSSDNKMYKVVRVDKEEYKGYAEFVEEVELPQIDEEAFKVVQEILTKKDQPAAALLMQQQSRKVGIYATHSGESYEPTDGTQDIPGKGGILKVANELKNNFERNGVEAILDNTSHTPHDAGAYMRSRRTAMQLLRSGQTTALIDVHRDATPAEAYLTEINGRPSAKVRLVLGRRNQNFKANEEMAWKIKAVADKMYPGLIKDIFYGGGNYNQDLMPRAMLAEFGTYSHTRERAERATEYFADSITAALFTGTFRNQQGVQENVRPQQRSNAGLGTGLGIVLLLIVGGGVAYLFISGGAREIRSKMSNFRQEFYNFLGRRRKKK